jgi:hypothetical protein
LLRTANFVDRVGPLPVELEDLGTEHEAPAAERDSVRLVGEPSVERRGPLLGAAQVERLLEGLDRSAVHNSGIRRRHVPGGHRDEGFVEQREAAIDLTHVDEGLAQAEARHCAQLRFVEASCDRCDLLEQPERSVVIAAAPGQECCRHEGDRPLGAVIGQRFEETVDSAHPAAGLG